MQIYDYDKEREDANASSQKIFIIPIDDNKPIKICFEGKTIDSITAAVMLKEILNWIKVFD